MAYRLLLVDDEVHIRASMGSYLEDEGFDVQTVGSAEAAIDIVKSHDFDVGVIDLRLPGMDGEKLILLLNQYKPSMRFIIHTGSSDFEIPPELGSIGITSLDVIKKPVKDLSIIASAVWKKCRPKPHP